MATSGSPHINMNERHCHDDQTGTHCIHRPFWMNTTPSFRSQLREAITEIEPYKPKPQTVFRPAGTRIHPRRSHPEGKRRRNGKRLLFLKKQGLAHLEVGNRRKEMTGKQSLAASQVEGDWRLER
ncbi:hypothetical protein [Rhizobium sp. BR 314]|uniref:hypothetical protein n=1 Tax=Rhizobium sp. BR 314 TaxID=3040013 RepID=UPI0039BFAE09